MIGRGNIEVSPGRKLAISNGVFEVPDTTWTRRPSRVRFRLDGSVAAAAELLEPRAAARLCGLADRSQHQPRQPHRACDAEHAAASPICRRAPRNTR